MATRIFLRGLGASAAYKARCSQSGAAPAPTMARAELRRKMRRFVMDDPPLRLSVLLKLGRAQGYAGYARGADLHAGYPVVRQLQGEIHARQQARRIYPLPARIGGTRRLLLAVN